MVSDSVPAYVSDQWRPGDSVRLSPSHFDGDAEKLLESKVDYTSVGYVKGPVVEEKRVNFPFMPFPFTVRNTKVQEIFKPTKSKIYLKAEPHQPYFHPSVTDGTHSFLLLARARQLFLP